MQVDGRAGAKGYGLPIAWLDESTDDRRMQEMKEDVLASRPIEIAQDEFWTGP